MAKELRIYKNLSVSFKDDNFKVSIELKNRQIWYRKVKPNPRKTHIIKLKYIFIDLILIN